MSWSVCLCANLCRAFYLLSFCSFEDIIASWFRISIAHYTVPYHFILKIKQNRIFKINDVGHPLFAFPLPLGRISKRLEYQPSPPFFIRSIWVALQSEKSLIMRWEAWDLLYKGSLGCLSTPTTSLPNLAGLWQPLLFRNKLKSHPRWLGNLEIPSIRVPSLSSFTKTQKMPVPWRTQVPVWQSSVSFATFLVLEETVISLESVGHVLKVIRVAEGLSFPSQAP